MENFKKSWLIANNDKFAGGFSSLTDDQLSKIKGGQKDAENSNDTCLNGICTGNNGDCTNKIQCT
ncbi:hypothetical protein NU08_1331 [Flavobacterium anhuiense]|uniref:Uncharacterized protein n=1 Tax=Flavobacterium anhuiense TaxID=459526 RepID=A0A444W1R6_9FLAO|nr:hypothetical protein [Flavobacterium anhuiense]RYJ39662.1 hypothetical protein NU08_1331 [Flavobacterium anhuiense]